MRREQVVSTTTRVSNRTTSSCQPRARASAIYLGMETRERSGHARRLVSMLKVRATRLLRRLEGTSGSSEVHRLARSEALEDGGAPTGREDSAPGVCGKGPCATSRASGWALPDAASRAGPRVQTPDPPSRQQIEDAFPYEGEPTRKTAIVETARRHGAGPYDGPAYSGDVGTARPRGRAACRGPKAVVRTASKSRFLVPTTLAREQGTGQKFRERSPTTGAAVEVVRASERRREKERGRQGH